MLQTLNVRCGNDDQLFCCKSQKRRTPSHVAKPIDKKPSQTESSCHFEGLRIFWLLSCDARYNSHSILHHQPFLLDIFVDSQRLNQQVSHRRFSSFEAFLDQQERLPRDDNVSCLLYRHKRQVDSKTTSTRN